MKKLCKILACLFVGFLILVPSFGDARSRFVQDTWKLTNPQTVKDPKIGNETAENIPQGIFKTTDKKLEGILQFPERSEYSTTLGYALKLIQISINWIIGILATVALIYMLYCGFLVFSSGADDKNAQKGRKGISTAAIALAGIGLSWLIVSAMIWFITILTEPK